MKSVLFLDKVFLRGKKSTVVTGAERFNLNLIAGLQSQGIEVTVPVARSWLPDMAAVADRGLLETIPLMSEFPVAWPNAALTSIAVYRRGFDRLLLGNVGRNLVPTVRILYAHGCFDKMVLLAHREPTWLFLKLFRNLSVTIVAVNDKINRVFCENGFPDVSTYFGEICPERFTLTASRSRGDKTHFCVFGNLDPDWKGSDTAISAFRALPPELRSKVHLHLAGYAKDKPRLDPGENITAYSWIDQNRVGEFLREMDVMIVPSRDTHIMKETFSQAAVQGMLCGLPLIVNDLPVLTEKVITGGGLIFRGVPQLVDHIITLERDRELRRRLGVEAAAIARRDFTWDTKFFIDRFLFPSLEDSRQLQLNTGT